MTITKHVESMLPAALVARSLGISGQTIRNLIHTGELAAVNVARPGATRARYAVTGDSLNTFLVARRVGRDPNWKAGLPRVSTVRQQNGAN